MDALRGILDLPSSRGGEGGLDLRDVAEAAEKRGDDVGVEVRAFAFVKNVDAFLQRERGLVGTLAGERVEDVGGGGDAAFERDVVAAQTARVAAAVPLFMM